MKTQLGLQDCKVALTGAAPIMRETLEFFGSLGIPVLEMFGMTECTGPTTINMPKVMKWGSIGYAPEGMEVQVFKTDGLLGIKVQIISSIPPRIAISRHNCRFRKLLKFFSANHH